MSAPMSGIVVASMRTLVALVLAMLIGVTGCKRPGRAGARRVAVADGGADGADVAVAAGGELAGDRASVALLIYYLPRPTTPPRPAFDALVAAEAGLTVVDELAAPPRAGLVWTAGRYRWTGTEYAWTDGQWKRQPAQRIWLDGRWERRGARYAWREGRWEAPSRRLR